VSAAEWVSYRTSPGHLLNMGGPAGSDMEARADQVLDDRDREHDATYGHLPGAAGCTLPSRERYRHALRTQLAAEERRCIVPEGCATGAAQLLIEQRAPWEYFPHHGGDPALEEARKDLAKTVAAGLWGKLG
jgi:hypothetical protein